MGFEWTDKRDNVDDVMADDINKLASGIKELFEIGKNKEEKSNKVETIDDIDGNHAHYPSEMAVIKYIRNTAELTKNKVGSIADETPLNPYDYPTANAVKSYIDDTVIPSIKSESNKKFALIENGVIEVEYSTNNASVLTGLSHNIIEYYDAKGNAVDLNDPQAHENLHTGIYKIKVKSIDEMIDYDDDLNEIGRTPSDSYSEDIVVQHVYRYNTKYDTIYASMFGAIVIRQYLLTGTYMDEVLFRQATIKLDGTVETDDYWINVLKNFEDCRYKLSNMNNPESEGYEEDYYPNVKAVKDYVDSASELNTIVNTAEGSLVNIKDSANAKLKGLKICGKTTQAAEPTVENPQELINVGNSGSIVTKVYEKNLLDISVNPILVKQEDGSYVNENGKVGITTFPLNLPYGSYTFSCDIKCPVGKNVRIKINLKDGTHIEYFKNSTNEFVHFKKQFIGAPKSWNFDYSANCAIGELVIKNAQLKVGSVETEYEPYKEPQTLTLNTPSGLPGVPVTTGGNYTDENGQQWICDEIDLARGKYVQRVGKYEVTGNEKWELHSSSSSGVYYRYDCTVSVPANIGATNIFDPLCMCTHYRTALNTADASSCCWVTNKTSTTNEAIGLRIKSTITSVNEFTQMLKSQYSNESSVTFYYILATPIETDLNLTEEEIAQYKALTTHKPVTNIFNDADAHMKIDYVADPKTYIDNKFAELTALILEG